MSKIASCMAGSLMLLALAAPSSSYAKPAVIEGDEEFSKRIAQRMEARAEEPANCVDRSVTIIRGKRGAPDEIVDLTEEEPWHAPLFDSSMTTELLVASIEAAGGFLDPAESLRTLQEEAGKKDGLALAALARLYESGTGVVKDIAEADRLRQQAAENGSVDSQVKLGIYYSEPNSDQFDRERAYKWFCRAAINYDKWAQLAVGRSDLFGQLSPQNIGSGIYWLEKAAENENSSAQLELGYLYLRNEEVPENLVLARKWTEMAATAGYPEAQNHLALMIREGLGAAADEKRAAFWLQQAAEQGYAQAQYNLGTQYDKGRGVPKNLVEAFYWYKKAAEQGYAPAQNNIGSAYYNGNGVPQNYTEGVRWLRTAASQGDATALYNLATSYLSGEGLVRNPIIAHVLYSLAATQGEESSVEQRDLIAQKLTKEELSKAQSTATVCYNSDFKNCPF